MDKEINNNEILEAINKFSTEVDKKFTKIDERFDGVDEKFNGINKKLGWVESNMVTKDYLDEKLADLRGDLVVLIRKEDNKVKKLVDILQKRDIISEDESREIFTMEPFAQISL